MIKALAKILKFCALMALSFLLFGGFPGLIQENVIDVSAQSAGKTYGARIVLVIPFPTCSVPLTSPACVNCRTGTWDDITISPVFGGDTSVQSNTYACKVPTFIPSGGGTCAMSEVIFGPAVTQQLLVNDFQTTNIWCQMQGI
jgi:hypothetical protein